MSSHGTVVDHRVSAGVRLRELDDSRRGARFSNRKEDKLLERKLTYLSNQNKRVQISINREKEFIRTRNPKENDKEMNHLDRRYKEAMGFILDYKTTSVLQDEQKRVMTDRRGGVKQSAMNKCIAVSRISSAPTHHDHTKNHTQRLRDRRQRPSTSGLQPWKVHTIEGAWLGKGLSKMSLESTSFSDSSDSESEEEELFRPFSGKLRPLPGSTGNSSCSTMSDKVPGMSRARSRTPGTRQLHRINTSVKNDFWSVLRKKRPQTAAGSADTTPQNRGYCTMASTARDIMVEQKVIKLFMKVDKLKTTQEGLPHI